MTRMMLPLGDNPRPPLTEPHGTLTVRTQLHPARPDRDRETPYCSLHPDADTYYDYHPCDCWSTFCRHEDWTEYVCVECGASWGRHP